MIGVLLFSRSERESSWAAVRGSRTLHLTGLSEGDLIRLKFRGNGHDGVEFMAMNKDSKFGIPEGVIEVMAIHEKASGSDVCVEME